MLDTWFSSALWPFATLGWPEDTPRYRAFYPGHALFTARDIINLWVARMIMMGIAFTGHEPFQDVVIHPTVLATDGRRMSKSLGTGVDPLDLIAEHGADATRYGLLKLSSTQDVRFTPGAIEEGRRLCNKLWNAARLILLNVDPGAEPARTSAEPVDAWVLGQLADATAEVTAALDAYDFAAAVKALYRFIWNDVCDWYLEAAKTRLYGDDAAARREASQTLLYVLSSTLRLAHPVLPHVTERIWGELGEEGVLARGALARSLAGAARPRGRAGRGRGVRVRGQAAAAARRRARWRRARHSRCRAGRSQRSRRWSRRSEVRARPRPTASGVPST